MTALVCELHVYIKKNHIAIMQYLEANQPNPSLKN